MARSTLTLLTIAAVLLLLLVFDPTTLWSQGVMAGSGGRAPRPAQAAESRIGKLSPRKIEEPRNSIPAPPAAPAPDSTEMPHAFEIEFYAFTPDGKPARGATILLGPGKHPLNEAKTSPRGILHRRFRARNPTMDLIWTCREDLSRGCELRRLRIKANELTRVPVLVERTRRSTGGTAGFSPLVPQLGRRMNIPNRPAGFSTPWFRENRFGWSEFAVAGRIEPSPSQALSQPSRSAPNPGEGRVLSGELLDALGDSLQGWDVLVQTENGAPWIRSAITGSSGRFRIEGVPPQTVTVSAYAPDHVVSTMVAREVWPEEGLRFRVDDRVRGAVQIGGVGRTSFASPVEIRLWNEATQRGRWIRANWEPTPLPAGNYRLILGGPGLPYRDRGTIEITAGETLNLGRIDLGPRMTLTGHNRRPNLRWVHPDVFSEIGVIHRMNGTPMPPGRYLKADGSSILLGPDDRLLPKD